MASGWFGGALRTDAPYRRLVQEFKCPNARMQTAWLPTGDSVAYAKSFVTALAFTSSRGWFRWFITTVSGSMPKLW